MLVAARSAATRARRCAANWNAPIGAGRRPGARPSGRRRGTTHRRSTSIAPGRSGATASTSSTCASRKILRFGRTRTNVGVDIYNMLNSGGGADLQPDVQPATATAPALAGADVGADAAVLQDRRADRLLDCGLSSWRGGGERKFAAPFCPPARAVPTHPPGCPPCPPSLPPTARSHVRDCPTISSTPTPFVTWAKTVGPSPRIRCASRSITAEVGADVRREVGLVDRRAGPTA